MVRFAVYCQKNNLKPFKALEDWANQNPEISEEQKKENILNWFNENPEILD
jgi:hypothetical protein